MVNTRFRRVLKDRHCMNKKLKAPRLFYKNTRKDADGQRQTRVDIRRSPFALPIHRL